MKIAVPKEIKNHEYRVAPTGVRHRAWPSCCLRESGGEGAGFPDSAYQSAGATIEQGVEALWQHAELILKVKEPQPEEERVSPLRLLIVSPNKGQRCHLYCYETITERRSLTCPHEYRGRMAVQAGAQGQSPVCGQTEVRYQGRCSDKLP